MNSSKKIQSEPPNHSGSSCLLSSNNLFSFFKKEKEKEKGYPLAFPYGHHGFGFKLVQ